VIRAATDRFLAELAVVVRCIWIKHFVGGSRAVLLRNSGTAKSEQMAAEATLASVPADLATLSKC
jgi:hypothetical protein